MNPLHPIDLGSLFNPAPDGYSVLGFIVLLPLIGAMLNGILGSRSDRQTAYLAGVGSVALSFVLACVAFIALVKSGHPTEGAAEGVADGAETARRALSYVPSYGGHVWDWFTAPTGPTTVEMIHVRYVLDPLSGVMALVVTGIGTLIHVYSMGYMSHDRSYVRFFAYLNLFVFSMLNLILGDSMVLMFLGWEGVGLCSYLLIGFWYTNADYAFAGRKAFIVNRIGDAGFILGMTILAWKGGSYQFETLRAHIAAQDSPFLAALAEHTHFGDFLHGLVPFLPHAITRLDFTWGGLACLLLFVGCCGKSAQLPLYVWLPDAMAGPTPVSALIHAATMVTAGVYLLCRLSFVYVHFTRVMDVIALVGASTALFAATIAVAQVELKKVLAYSTVSQLGFMFMGCGVGAFSAGFFHVFTHAFFKACLFLAAGAVMHACRDNQDLRKLGGLHKYLPITHGAFLVATLAIIGMPPFSGFFSKDEILFRAFTDTFDPQVGRIVYGMGVLAATLTSFYMVRLYILTFFGDFKGWSLTPTAGEASTKELGSETTHGHGHGPTDPHAPPSEHGLDMQLMTYPLVVLAGFALLAGIWGLPFMVTHHEGTLATFLDGTVSDAGQVGDHSLVDHSREGLSMVGGILALLIGAGSAVWVYLVEKGVPAKRLAEALPGLYRLVFDKWRVDELYDRVIVRPVKALAGFATNFDRFVIDGIVNLIGWIALGLGRVLRLAHNGSVQVYAGAMSVGAAVLLGWMVFLPHAALTSQGGAAGDTVMLAAGGPGFTYRWALYDPNPDALTDGDRCTRHLADEAIGHTAEREGTTVNSLSQRLQNPRCVAVEARNAFGFRTVATAYVVPAGGAPVLNPAAAPGNGN